MSGPPSFEPLDDRPWDGAKRKIILALLATSSLAVLGAGSAEAVRTRYPFCMGGATSPGLSNCSFTSLAQCRATASGRRLTCIANPFYKRR
ncbi:DUF3551 domain-containing protein [Bradyrhizobium sp.]|uniref:DUF3551 domain-containing protein n=1 Tax=Bradyrhizobium sp. TaxID=376 RepID=UPI003C776E7E